MFSVKGQRVNLRDIVGHTAFAATTEFCLCSHRQYEKENDVAMFQ